MNGVDPAYQSLPGGGLTKKLEKEMDKKIAEALDGVSAKSAYQSYVDTTTDNPPKTEAEWVSSLKGEDGVHVTSLVKTGTSGLTDIYTITFSDNTTQTFTITNGQTGETGPVGPIGFTGKSAYQSYYDTTQDNPKKTEVEWLESLKGEDGDPGVTGPQGPTGPKGDNGVGFASASSPSTADGTWQIELTNGDTITIDLNHVHPQYPKYELVQSLPASPDSGTLYLIAAE